MTHFFGKKVVSTAIRGGRALSAQGSDITAAIGQNDVTAFILCCQGVSTTVEAPSFLRRHVSWQMASEVSKVAMCLFHLEGFSGATTPKIFLSISQRLAYSRLCLSGERKTANTV